MRPVVRAVASPYSLFVGAHDQTGKRSTNMAQTENQRRASDAVAAWLAARRLNPAWLVDETGADPGTINDFLRGARWPKLSTQGKIEAALGWEPGTVRKIGNGGPVPPVSESVGAAAEDGGASERDALLFRRPPGLTDDEWERIKRESRGFIEWQVQRTLRT